MAKTRRRYSSRRRARGRKVKHSVKRRVHKKRNNRGRGKSKRRSRGKKHSRRMRRGGMGGVGAQCQPEFNKCCKMDGSDPTDPQTILENNGNKFDGWYECL